MHNSLPTSYTLYKRRITQSMTCSLCNYHTENIPHIFFFSLKKSYLKCVEIEVISLAVMILLMKYAKKTIQIWKYFHISPPTVDFPTWIRTKCTITTHIKINTQLILLTHILTPLILWQLWLTRNHNYFHCSFKPINPCIIINFATEQYFLTSIPTRSPRTLIPIKWKAPPPSHIKLNIDGAFDNISSTGG